MILIFILCLKLSILHICVSDLGYQCARDVSNNNPEIFLIEDIGLDTIYQELLNDEFLQFCKHYYNIKIVPLEESGEHDNVIRFAVPDYSDDKLPKNFVYAGNISNIDNAACTKTGQARPGFECDQIVNLVSESVLEINDGHVYNLVRKMLITEFGDEKSCEPFFRNTSDLTTVLLCSEPLGVDKTVNILPLQLIQVTASNCSYYLDEMRRDLNVNKNRLLAVLAPEPFNVLSEYFVPTIFYKTPYLFSEYKTAFPNSMNLVPWRLLKYGYLMFIQTVGWQRVAIVTDDSEYNLDFEEELTALFHKERIIYTVIRCEDANCEMGKIARELGRVSARVVIANVEEKHAQYLFQNVYHKTTWLVRDMVGNRHNQNLGEHQVAFSLSLSIDTFTKGCDVEDNILTGLSSIAQAYKNTAEEDYKLNQREFYRRFTDRIKQVTPRITEATVVVHKLHSLEHISTISVNAAGAKLNFFTNPFISGKPTDGTAHCLVTSYDYHKPCEDHLVMFLMLTLMLFMLTFILIIRYFDKTSPYNDIRYHNF